MNQTEHSLSERLAAMEKELQEARDSATRGWLAADSFHIDLKKARDERDDARAEVERWKGLVESARSQGMRIDVRDDGQGWAYIANDRAAKAEAESERLNAECNRHAAEMVEALQDVERLRKAAQEAIDAYDTNHSQWARATDRLEAALRETGGET